MLPNESRYQWLCRHEDESVDSARHTFARMFSELPLRIQSDLRPKLIHKDYVNHAGAVFETVLWHRLRTAGWNPKVHEPLGGSQPDLVITIPEIGRAIVEATAIHPEKERVGSERRLRALERNTLRLLADWPYRVEVIEYETHHESPSAKDFARWLRDCSAGLVAALGHHALEEDEAGPVFEYAPRQGWRIRLRIEPHSLALPCEYLFSCVHSGPYPIGTYDLVKRAVERKLKQHHDQSPPLIVAISSAEETFKINDWALQCAMLGTSAVQYESRDLSNGQPIRNPNGIWYGPSDIPFRDKPIAVICFPYVSVCKCEQHEPTLFVNPFASPAIDLGSWPFRLETVEFQGARGTIRIRESRRSG